MVSPEHEGRLLGGGRIRDETGDTSAALADLGQEPGALVVNCRRLRLRAGDVAVILDLVAEASQPLLEPGRPHRRRAHVDPAPPLPEVERGADDRDLPLPIGHGAERYCTESGLD
jgi:hypothetical protein